jgi:uncharacterized membrane protein YkvA (DUF1232 family)
MYWIVAAAGTVFGFILSSLYQNKDGTEKSGDHRGPGRSMSIQYATQNFPEVAEQMAAALSQAPAREKVGAQSSDEYALKGISSRFSPGSRSDQRYYREATPVLAIEAVALYRAMIDPDTSEWAKMILSGALGYLIAPDPIPGALDDLAIVWNALKAVQNQVKAEHVHQAVEWLKQRISVSDESVLKANQDLDAAIEGTLEAMPVSQKPLRITDPDLPMSQNVKRAFWFVERLTYLDRLPVYEEGQFRKTPEQIYEEKEKIGYIWNIAWHEHAKWVHEQLVKENADESVIFHFVRLSEQVTGDPRCKIRKIAGY